MWLILEKFIGDHFLPKRSVAFKTTDRWEVGGVGTQIKRPECWLSNSESHELKKKKKRFLFFWTYTEYGYLLYNLMIIIIFFFQNFCKQNKCIFFVLLYLYLFFFFNTFRFILLIKYKIITFRSLSNNFNCIRVSFFNEVLHPFRLISKNIFVLKNILCIHIVYILDT